MTVDAIFNYCFYINWYLYAKEEYDYDKCFLLTAIFS